jgi:hypothetical protein
MAPSTLPSTENSSTAGVYDTFPFIRFSRFVSEDVRSAVRSAPISLLYKGYLRSATDANDGLSDSIFERLCLHFHCIPSIDLINWIIQKADIIDERCRLNFPVYAFLQHFVFKVSLSDETDEPRMLVGYLNREHGVEQVWLGWSGAEDRSQELITAAKTRLYDAPQARKGICPLEFIPEVREYIRWIEPLEMLFEMSKFTKAMNLKTAVKVQNAILLSVAKVVFRFPGLTNRRIRTFPFSEYSKWPFTRFDCTRAPLRKHPYETALKILNFGQSPADGVHRCHPPDQQLIPGNKATENNTDIVKKRKRDGTEGDPMNDKSGCKKRLIKQDLRRKTKSLPLKKPKFAIICAHSQSAT